MDLKAHVRAITSHSLDKLSESDIDEGVATVKRNLRLAKKGKTGALFEDIRNTAAILRGLDKIGRLDRPKAYLALRNFVDLILSECPHMRAELTAMLAPCFDLRITLH